MFKGGRGPPRLAFGAGGGLAGRGCLGFRAGGGVSRTGSGSMGESPRVGRPALTCSTYSVCAVLPSRDSRCDTYCFRLLAVFLPIPLFLAFGIVWGLKCLDFSFHSSVLNFFLCAARSSQSGSNSANCQTGAGPQVSCVGTTNLSKNCGTRNLINF